MEGYPYLGSGRLCGAQIRYRVRSEAGDYLGGLSFSGATRRLRARDTWIEWSEKAQHFNLGKIVCNSRFLIILPGITGSGADTIGFDGLADTNTGLQANLDSTGVYRITIGPIDPFYNGKTI